MLLKNVQEKKITKSIVIAVYIQIEKFRNLAQMFRQNVSLRRVLVNDLLTFLVNIKLSVFIFC